MLYEDIVLAEEKGVWRRFIGRVRGRDLAEDLGRDAQHIHEQETAAAEKAKASEDARQQELERKKQQDHAAKVQELFQQASWVRERERAYATGGEKALQRIIAQHEMKAKREIARTQDRETLFNRPPSRNRSHSIGR